MGFESFEETFRIFLVDEKYILPKISAKAKSIIQHYNQNKTSNLTLYFLQFVLCCSGSKTVTTLTVNIMVELSQVRSSVPSQIAWTSRLFEKCESIFHNLGNGPTI